MNLFNFREKSLFKTIFHDKSSQEIFEKISSLLSHDLEEVTPATVYKPGNTSARLLFRKVLKKFIFDTSRIVNPEHLRSLFDLSQQGHACLLLPEHYGNFDMSNLCYLSDQDSALGESFANSLIAVAGIKISRDDIIIATFARMYNRVVIYPSRGFDSIIDENQRDLERKRTLPINLASIKEVMKRRHQKQMFLVFPSGTRIRSWDKETLHGVPEVFNYLRMFEYVCLLSVNGNNLPVNRLAQTMSDDLLQPDHIFFGVSPVMRTTELITQLSKSKPEDQELKSFVVSKVMKELFRLHDKTEVIRQIEIRKTS